MIITTIVVTALIAGATGYVIGHSAGYSECRDFLKRRGSSSGGNTLKPYTFGVTHEEKNKKEEISNR